MNINFYYNYVYLFIHATCSSWQADLHPCSPESHVYRQAFVGASRPRPPKGLTGTLFSQLRELCPWLPPWEGAAGVHCKARGGRGASAPAVQSREHPSARPLDHPTLLPQAVMRRWTVCGTTSIFTGFCSVLWLVTQAVPSATGAETTLSQRTCFCQIIHSGPQTAATPRKGPWPPDRSRKTLLPGWLAAASPPSSELVDVKNTLKRPPQETSPLRPCG